MNERIKKLIKQILGEGYLMSIAVMDEGGVWVSDVIHDYDLNIYWMSNPDARHSKAIIKDKRAAGTITVDSASNDDKGIQFEGTAEKIDGAAMI